MSEFFTLKKKLKETLIEENIRASNLFPVLAFDEKFLFLCDDKTIGFGMVCSPLSGSDEKTEQQINALLNEEYPTNTQLQFILSRSPDINQQIHEIEHLRETNRDPLMASIIKERVDYLNHYTSEKMGVNNNKGVIELGNIFDLKLLVTVKIPISNEYPSESEYEKITSLRTKVVTTLSNVRLQPKTLTAESWISYMSTVFNWDKSAAWRFAKGWDKSKLLNEQVLDYENDIEISSDYLRIGKKYARCLSAKRFPEHTFFGHAISNVGDLTGGLGGIRQHYITCTNVTFLEPDKEKQRLETKRQFAVNQATGPIVRFVPILIDKKDDFNDLYSSLQDGNKPLKIAYHVVVFGDSISDVESAAMNARNLWRTNRFEIMIDKFIQLPIFINCLPFCSDRQSMIDLNRHKTLTTKEASTLLPIFGEWKGTGTHHVNLLSRNMQLMSFSLHDTGSNMNAVIAAQSGSGKSFLTNEIISSYLSEGAQVWVIDVGRSYEKLCDIYRGEFLHFGADSNVCLNPFSLTISLDGTLQTRSPDVPLITNESDDDGEEDALVGLIEAMAAPTKKLDDFQISALKKTLNKVWSVHYRNTSIDLIQEALLAHTDERIRDVGHQLYAFSSQGSYGRFFNGENTIKFKNRFTVLELEELKGRKHLQQVVLLQLIYQIQQEMYLNDRNRKKVIIIDEAWDLLTQGDVAKFVEAGYRRFRKYGGSVVIVTQSINDLYNSPTGMAIDENSATTLLLGQKSETVENIKRSGKLQLSDVEYEQLKTVHTIPGVYSEIFIKSEFGRGIGRLIVNDFQKLLYSTTAEDVNAINELKKQGYSTIEAINILLAQQKGGVNEPH